MSEFSLNILQRGWQALSQRLSPAEPSVDTYPADESEQELAPSSGRLWLILAMGLTFSLLVGWALVALNTQTNHLERVGGAAPGSAVQVLQMGQSVA